MGQLAQRGLAFDAVLVSEHHRSSSSIQDFGMANVGWNEAKARGVETQAVQCGNEVAAEPILGGTLCDAKEAFRWSLVSKRFLLACIDLPYGIVLALLRSAWTERIRQRTQQWLTLGFRQEHFTKTFFLPARTFVATWINSTDSE